MSLDLTTIRHITKLARLRPPESELPKLSQDLNAVLELFSKLQSVSVEGVDPLFHPGDPQLRLRADKAEVNAQKAALLAIAPEMSGDLFLVPKVLESGS